MNWIVTAPTQLRTYRCGSEKDWLRQEKHCPHWSNSWLQNSKWYTWWGSVEERFLSLFHSTVRNRSNAFLTAAENSSRHKPRQHLLVCQHRFLFPFYLLFYKINVIIILVSYSRLPSLSTLALFSTQQPEALVTSAAEVPSLVLPCRAYKTRFGGHCSPSQRSWSCTTIPIFLYGSGC